MPEDVAVAPDGTLYVTDLFNSRIRKIAHGQVSTFAGNGKQDIADGNGDTAEFIFPFRIVMDSSGNLYTTDGVDPRIRKITPAADVYTFSGLAMPGFQDGKADIARFKQAAGGIAADARGGVYISDTYNHRIRKVTASGTVITSAGSGEPGALNAIGTAAQFNHPAGIAVDHNGTVYVADRANRRIRTITPDGQVAVFAGSGVKGILDGPALIAQFDELQDLALDGKGNVYLTDDHRVRKISIEGIVSTIAGSDAGYADGEGSAAKFNYPSGLDIDSNGNLYVADIMNNRVRKISFE